MHRVAHPVGARVEYPGGVPMLVVDLDLGRDLRVCAWRTAHGPVRERQFRAGLLRAARAR